MQLLGYQVSFREQTFTCNFKRVEANNLHFIDHSNIVLSDHILEDGVHFNETGTTLFSANLIGFLTEMCS